MFPYPFRCILIRIYLALYVKLFFPLRNSSLVYYKCFLHKEVVFKLISSINQICESMNVGGKSRIQMVESKGILQLALRNKVPLILERNSP